MDKSGPVALIASLDPALNALHYPIMSNLLRTLPVLLVLAPQPVSLQGGSAQIAERWANLKMAAGSIPY